MQKRFKILLIATTIALSACGGGGGSPGETQEHYSITLRADKAQLPINIADTMPGLGAYRPYTTTLYVEARKGNLPIPGGEDIFACNVAGGLDSGALYYLDGKAEHETEVDDGNGGKVKIPNAYRNITLGSNAGGNSFHFHAGDQAGNARITCTVQDPLDKQQKSASVEISVGGATGKPASVRLAAQVNDILGTKFNANGILNQMAIQAFVMDDANQPTGSTSGSNVQVRILSGTDAAVGARLVAGSQSGSVLQLPSIGGVALFSLLSGTETGTIFLEMTADRADNNVSNGISEPMVGILPIQVMAARTIAPTIDNKDLGTITKGVPFTAYLEAKNGLPPFTWSATGLPTGLTVDASTGILSGTVSQDAAEREYRVTVTATDKNKISATATITFKVVGGLPEDFAIGDCNSTAVCSLGTAPVGKNFTYSFVSSTTGVTWSFAGLPAWLTAGTSPTAGVLNGVPKVTNCGSQRFLVTATKGVTSVTRTFNVDVVTGSIPPGGVAADYTCP
ncbi:hypothetical protein GmRootA79_39360 [Acidovorax sp. A79]|uniref:putative Ig domain-containing protein n=1 Tax=Acidovorax sp. A79 TaxID=3056107 RepID=UPI0034E8DE86